MNRTLIVFGILLLVAGLGWPWLKQLPLGRLPGDLHIARASCRLFLPLTTCLLLIKYGILLSYSQLAEIMPGLMRPKTVTP